MGHAIARRTKQQQACKAGNAKDFTVQLYFTCFLENYRGCSEQPHRPFHSHCYPHGRITLQKPITVHCSVEVTACASIAWHRWCSLQWQGGAACCSTASCLPALLQALTLTDMSRAPVAATAAATTWVLPQPGGPNSSRPAGQAVARTRLSHSKTH